MIDLIGNLLDAWNFVVVGAVGVLVWRVMRSSGDSGRSYPVPPREPRDSP